MPLITRLYDFVNGQRADADEVDQEFLVIHDLLNGYLDDYNIANLGIGNAKIRDLDGNKILANTLPKSALSFYLAEINDSIVANNLLYSSEKIEALLALKANQATTYTKTEVDGLVSGLNGTIETENLATRQQLTDGLALKRDITDSYSKTETDTALGLKADKATTYTKTETDTALGLKADKADTYTKTEVDTALTGKSDSSHTHAELHTHTNKTTLDKIGESEGVLTFDGALVGSGGGGGGAGINDTTTSTTSTWSSSKISSELDSIDVYTKTESDEKFEGKVPSYTSFPDPAVAGEIIEVNGVEYIGVGGGVGTTDIAPVLTSDTSDPSVEVLFSSANGSYSAFKAFNNNVSTSTDMWLPNATPTPHFIGIGWTGGVRKAFGGYSITSQTSGGVQYRPASWKVRVSNDKVSWTEVASVTSQSFNAGEKKPYTLPGLFSFSYIQFYDVKTADGTSAPAIGEIEIFEGGLPTWEKYTPTFENGIQTGASKFWASNREYGADFNNSDIIGVNGLYFGDPVESLGEGLLFPKSTTTADSSTIGDYDKMWVHDGLLHINSVLFQTGRSIVTPLSGGAVTSFNVTFPKAFATAPIVNITSISSVPGNITCSVGNVSSTGFTIFMTRTDTNLTHFYWSAMIQTTPTL